MLIKARHRIKLKNGFIRITDLGEQNSKNGGVCRGDFWGDLSKPARFYTLSAINLNLVVSQNNLIAYFAKTGKK